MCGPPEAVIGFNSNSEPSGQAFDLVAIVYKDTLSGGDQSLQHTGVAMPTTAQAIEIIKLPLDRFRDPSVPPLHLRATGQACAQAF